MTARLTTVPTYTATIYVGFKHRPSGDVPSDALATVKYLAGCYCDDVGLCVTVTPTTFVYTKGDEPGAAVGLINYPRFPSDAAAIRRHALTLAERMMEAFWQWRVSVVLPDETVMLSSDDAPQDTD